MGLAVAGLLLLHRGRKSGRRCWDRRQPPRPIAQQQIVAFVHAGRPSAFYGRALVPMGYLFDSGSLVFAGDWRQGRCTAATVATRPGWVAWAGLRPVGLGLAIRLR